MRRAGAVKDRRQPNEPDYVRWDARPLVHGAPAGTEFRLFAGDDAIVLTGEIDFFGADRLRALLEAAGGETPEITLDVSGLTFVDGAGTSVLASWAEELAQRGTRVTLRGAGRMLRRVWRVLQLPEPEFA